MATYQIYKMIFDRSRQKNLLSVDGKCAFDRVQEILENSLKNKLPIEREKRDKSLVSLDNYVERTRDGVTVLVVCNEKKHKYKEKMQDKELEYHPGCRVIIDNRDGVAQLAIERSTSFDDNTEKVRVMLEAALNKCLDPYELTVEIRAKKRDGEFWDAISEQSVTHKDTIKQVTYEFPDEDEGPIDAPKETQDMMKVLRTVGTAMNAARASYTAYSDKRKTIRLDRTQEDIFNMVALCCHNGYNISVHFKHYGVFRYGSQIKALSTLKDDVVKEFVDGQQIMGKATEGEWSLVNWLNEMRKLTENYNDEEEVRKERKRSHK